MDRRELLKSIAVLTGASVIGADVFLSGCKPTASVGLFDKKTISLLDEIAETIIPATNTPGAKAAEVGSFMNAIVSDCYTPEEQKVFISGLKALEESAKKSHNKNFNQLSDTEKHDFVVSLEKEAKAYNEKKAKNSPSHYYTMIKQLTLWGFFTSKTGMTETLRHVPVPGKYQGDLTYVKGDKAWAE